MLGPTACQKQSHLPAFGSGTKSYNASSSETASPLFGIRKRPSMSRLSHNARVLWASWQTTRAPSRRQSALRHLVLGHCAFALSVDACGCGGRTSGTAEYQCPQLKGDAAGSNHATWLTAGIVIVWLVPHKMAPCGIHPHNMARCLQRRCHATLQFCGLGSCQRFGKAGSRATTQAMASVRSQDGPK